jgi:hypothetical protein
LEDLGVDGIVILDGSGVGWEVVDWIHLAQDRGQLCVLVNTVMNFWIPKRKDGELLY